MDRFQQKQQIDTVISSGFNHLVLDPGFSIGIWSAGRKNISPYISPTRGDFQKFCGGTKRFLPPEDFHDY